MNNNIPTQADEWLSLAKTDGKQKQTFYYITNRDQTIRWIWPTGNKTPKFLTFYAATNLKSHLFIWLCKAIYAFGLQRLFFKQVSLIKGNFKEKLGLCNETDWAMFTGTPGPNRKALIACQCKEGKSLFLKLSVGQNAASLLLREYASLNICKELALDSAYTPEPLEVTANWLKLSALEPGSRSLKLNHIHLNFLKELRRKTKLARPLKDVTFWKQCLSKLRTLDLSSNENIPRAMKRKIQWFLAKVNENQVVELNYAHGDFTPWNCYINKGKVAIYDLELAQNNMPLGFDAFHFVVQKGILVERKSWIRILKEIETDVTPKLFDGDLKKSHNYLALYLANQILYSLELYTKQKVWHEQIHWLLNTWNEALSWILQGYVPERKLVLMDVFDFVQSTPYAALKFKGILPEYVSVDSDVDLCLSKSTAKALHQYLKSHPLVSKMRIARRSFMSTSSLILTNKQRLHIDCIWKLKRKSLVFQDIDALIESATMNVFGVKQPTSVEETTYVNMFYYLNGSTPPKIYQSKSIEQNLNIDVGPQQSNKVQKQLKRNLASRKDNQGMSGFKNMLNYIIDSVKNLLFRPGFTVTFSGVDGVGKSTLIEITKKTINKQLRKPVVVLRHRPSILPILSSWTLGKKEAEIQAGNRLPRQGNNNNMISSLFRFAYYFTDYFFGQFYIYFKYVLRGKVVLYDRYYFDFISDCKRSNILLPQWLTRLGYYFILKPNFNFFLYADAKTILSRKQELDERTIDELTKNYRGLFDDLKKNSARTVYRSYQNLNSIDTLDRIMSEIKLQSL